MDMNLILASIGVFLVVVLTLVAILLVAKKFLVASGPVKIKINGEQELEVESVHHCLPHWLLTTFTCHQHVVVRELVDSASARS